MNHCVYPAYKQIEKNSLNTGYWNVLGRGAKLGLKWLNMSLKKCFFDFTVETCYVCMCNALIREACVVMKLNRKLCFNLFLLTESSIWDVAWVWGNHQLAEANGRTSSLSVLAGGHGRLQMTVLCGRLAWPLWRVDRLSKDRKHPHDKYSQSTELRSWRTWKHFYAFYCSIAALQRLKDEGCEVNKPNE